MIRPGDAVILLAAIALIVALGSRIYSGASVETVRVTGFHDQEDFPAWRDRTVHIGGPLGETVIEIRDGRARVVASPCTRKICIRHGWLENAGEATVCVPNRVSLALLGGDPRFDAVNF